MALEAIFAIDDNLGFGRAGALPWPFLKEDMEHFKKVTKDKKLIMGRNTFKS
jgi:dihydrofolate reductase